MQEHVMAYLLVLDSHQATQRFTLTKYFMKFEFIVRIFWTSQGKHLYDCSVKLAFLLNSARERW